MLLAMPMDAWVAWSRTQSAAAITAALADPGHPSFAAMAAIADACDSADAAERDRGLRALFAGVVEALNDGLDAPGRAASACWFAHAAWRCAARDPDLRAALAEDGIADEAALVARHARLRAGSDPWPAQPRRIAVLSRVTVGADILLTSVLLQRLHGRWPAAELVLIGDGKLAGLLALPGVRVVPVAYQRRGTLGERLRAWLAVRKAVRDQGADLVVSPDSRLDQLGLFPTHPDPARHRLWENLQPAPARPEGLSALLDAWCDRELGGSPAVPRVALAPAYAALAERLRAALGPGRWCAVKLDTGGNPAKALPRAAEIQWLRALRAAGWGVVLDRGFGPAELAASDALCADAGLVPVDLDEGGTLGRDPRALMAGDLAAAGTVRFHGSIAGWAAAVAGCTRALSYDSVGQHLAAALGVPVVVPFAGFSGPAFITAWSPRGAPATVIAVADPADGAVWTQVSAALTA
jgi:ADP-heptose:LPS heptosyltransferase